MTIFLVRQLQFARRELTRCLDGITAEEGVQRFGQMNCISWMIGHLAAQENFLWVYMAQEIKMHGDLVELVAFGKPASTPPLEQMWGFWQDVTQTADEYLNNLTEEQLTGHLLFRYKPQPENIGTSLLRNIYHYWFHIGEAHAVRQQMGHQDLPQFVGYFEDAVYP